MKYIVHLILLLFVLVHFSCSGSKEIKENNLAYDYFIIGSGGGVSGRYETYKITADSKVYSINKQNLETEVAILSTAQTSLYFNQLKALNLDYQKIDYPGDISFYIILPVEDKENRIQWGSGNFQINPEVQAFFKTIEKEIKKVKK